MIKVSVIIPTYNRANLLKRAIRSVLAQTYRNFELIVVDDGSTDNTKQICSNIRFEHIKCVREESNFGGAARPKNTGIKISQGEYIAILDDDDQWLPKKLEEQIKFLEKYPDVAIVGCNFLINEKKEYKIPHYKNVFKRMLVTDDMGPGSTMMYKREVFDKVGLFDENLKSGQDKEMRIRLSLKFKFGFIRKPLVIYYIGHDSLSSKLNISRMEKDWEYIYNKYKKYYTKSLYGNKLRYDGTRYMMLGFPKKARKSFIYSIKNNPLNIKSYLYFFISLFKKRFYQGLTKIKLWLK